MNGKCFTFGKNYDSDYLSAKRLKRMSCGQRNVRRFGSKIFTTKDKPMTKLKPKDNCRQHRIKANDRRLTLQPKLNTNSDDEYMNRGLFANAKTSHDKCLDRFDRQFKARIDGDLFWILNKKSESKPMAKPMTKSMAKPMVKPMVKPIAKVIEKHQKSKKSVIYKPFYVEKQTQKNSIITLEEMSDEDYNGLNPNEDNYKYNALRLSQTKDQMIGRKVVANCDKNSDNCLTKLKTKYKMNCFKNIDHKRRDDMRSGLPLEPSMPSLPSSLTIVQNLMKSYENESKRLSQIMPEFGQNYIIRSCNELKEISKSYNQSIDQNIVENDFNFKDNTNVIIYTPKPSKATKDKTIEDKSEESDKQLSVFQSVANNPMTVSIRGHLKPKVGEIVSKILLNISEVFQSLSNEFGQKLID